MSSFGRKMTFVVKSYEYFSKGLCRKSSLDDTESCMQPMLSRKS